MKIIYVTFLTESKAVIYSSTNVCRQSGSYIWFSDIPEMRETQMSRIISSKWPQKECDAKRASN